MQGLRDQPQLRANILVIATGVRGKIALKKSAESCGQDLQIAIAEGETDAETVVALFDPDDRVRYLDAAALWAYLTEGSFWQVERDKDKAKHAPAAQHIAFMIDRALRDRLLTHRDIVEGVTVAKLTELLPRSELGKIITAALELGRSQKPYVETNLLAAVPTATLVQHVPLAWIWEHVVVTKIAPALGIKANAAAPPATKEPARAEPAAAAPAASAPKAKAADEEAVIIVDGGQDNSMDLEIDDILGSDPKPKAATVPKPAKA